MNFAIGRHDVALFQRSPARDLTFDVPAGAFALWVKGTKASMLTSGRWLRESKGAFIVTAATFTFDRKPQPSLRLGFSSLTRGRYRKACAVLPWLVPLRDS